MGNKRKLETTKIKYGVPGIVPLNCFFKLHRTALITKGLETFRQQLLLGFDESIGR
mgnify:FL=1